MEFTKKVLIVLFGVNWKTSLIGYLGGVAIAAAALLQDKTEPGWMLLAFALAALGRAAKDSGVTGGTTPVTPEAANRVAPK
jgi:hypothetical protein